MADIKHVGRIKNTNRKCLVVFRTLPGDAFNCLVVLTESLPNTYHDAIINLVESNVGQTSYELADALNRNTFSDGTIMLASLHVQGFLQKYATDQIEMTPNASTAIKLADLNQIIAEQRGISVQDLAIKPPQQDPNVEVQEVGQVNEVAPPLSDPLTQQQDEVLVSEAGNNVLSDSDLAAKYRNDAELLLKEAAELQKQAEALDPSPVAKKTTRAKKPAAAAKKGTTTSRARKTTAN